MEERNVSLQLKLTLWKCWKSRWHNYVYTLLTICLPILLYSFVAWYYTKGGVIYVRQENPTYGIQVSEEQIEDSLYGYKYSYAPSNEYTNKIIRMLQLEYQYPNNVINNFETEEEMITFHKQHTDVDNILIYFQNTTNSVPKTMKYKIRQETISKSLQNLYYDLPGPGASMEVYRSFVTLQMHLNKYYLELLNISDNNIEFTMEEFPFPPYVDDKSNNLIFTLLFPMLTCLTFSFVGPYIVIQMIDERQSGIKEYMKMMGLSPIVMWISWFLDNILIIMIPIISIVCILTIPNNSILSSCNPIIYFLFLILYNSSNISVCYIIAALCKNGSLALILQILFNVFTLILCLFCYMNVFMSNFTRYLICFIPNGSLIFGYYTIKDHLVMDNEVTFSNLFSTYNGHTESLGGIMLILLFTTILLISLACYIDAISPGKYGIPKRWYYPFYSSVNALRRYILNGNEVGIKTYNIQEESGLCSDMCTVKMTELTEKCNLKICIEIKDLTKTYGNRKAVDSLNMNIYKGEIMALLGPNGAGKTTTMSIITGLINQTRGSVTIEGLDLHRDLDKIRTLLGICPQDDLFFRSLTVREHLLFIAKMNQLKNADAKVDEMLEKLSLMKHSNHFPNNISGGMKRRLCFGMALVADPKIVILDEPTSGLDPISRRNMWNVLSEWRRSHSEPRTVLLSTHQIEEAEELANRITILNQGTLAVQGTMNYLRHTHLSGCHLDIVYKENDDELTKNKVNEIIANSDPRIDKNKLNGEHFELTLTDKPEILELLKQLEKLDGIKDITVNNKSLEELFFNLIQNTEETTTKLEFPPVNDNNGKLYQWKSIFKLRLVTLRNTIQSYIIFALPAITLLIIGLLLGRPSILKYASKHQFIEMSLEEYGPTTVFFSGQRNNSIVNRIMNEYKHLVAEQKSIAIEVPSAKDALLEFGTRNFMEYSKKAIAAADFITDSEGRIKVNVLYSELAVHAPPIALNLAWNSVLKAYTNNNYSIDVTSQPMRLSYFETNIVMSYIVVTSLFLGFSIFITYFVGFPLVDRESGIKHLELMTGVHIYFYWIINYVFDFILYLLTLFIFAVVYILCYNPVYTFHELGGFAYYSIIFGIVGIMFSYLLSNISSKSIAYSVSISNNIIIAMLCIVFVYVLKFFYPSLGQTLDIASLAIPMYWYINKVWNYTNKVVWNWEWNNMSDVSKIKYCRVQTNPCCLSSVAAHDLSEECQNFMNIIIINSIDFVYIVATILIYLGLIAFFDKSYIKRIKKETLNESTGNLASAIKCRNINKSYGKSTVLNNLQFTLPNNTYCGLLAPNGSGKTTTFEMLARKQIDMNNGSISINGIEYQDIYNYMKNIGYCPQYNALNLDLTAKQMLDIFAELRECKDREKVVDNCIKLVDLSEFKSIKCGEYSGGNKRKLCIALAIIGSPSLMLLDEPTTGIDPVSRRTIWNALKEKKYNSHSSMLLSSHSMAECEFLCDSLAFMKDGSIQKPEKIASLISKYGADYVVNMKLNDNCNDVDEVDGNSSSRNYSKIDVIERFKELFKDSIRKLKDDSASNLSYYIIKDKIKLTKVFEHMEKMKAYISNYEIRTANLEESFVMFSNDSNDKTN
ncbi:PREDICTED: ATP-binding cassette sub-family A member 2-like isoform X2 [Nicrophorus vespilloides]|uniref:ATP-binding cassette sub-family A member 2-like isoform X2 n=1 Tax=Nicrophorus vespilloides TaxID=110193 RepID=A0ABM1MWI1_NICVS|nr:PREDICTED: ATP-binding cassette sub-family A member 2-like isoform X2 [Nicrophorus vespilloides]